MTDGTLPSAKHPGPWCAECGYPAHVTDLSIDARYPLGRCHRGKAGCNAGGRVALVLTRADANAAYDRRRRRLTTGRHSAHHPDKLPEYYCDRCPHTMAEVEERNTGTNTAGK
jgi:hypothetical protein